MAEPDFIVDGVGCTLGGFRVLDDVSLTLTAGEKHGVIGPNGAGKSTLFNVLTGFIRRIDGRVQIGEERISGLRPERVVAQGVVRTFQTPRVLHGWTVLDCVRLAAEQSGSSRRAVRRALGCLHAVGMADQRDHHADTLSTAQLRHLSIATCLAHQPRVMLLDEPTAGMDESETIAFADLMRRLHADHGFTIGLVEHKLSFLMTFCDRVTVLDAGRVIARGTPQQVAADPVVVEAYLGVTTDD